jgi:hypothetical protein
MKEMGREIEGMKAQTAKYVYTVSGDDQILTL